MEALVLIKEVGAYSERQYQRQDGTTEYFKSRGVVLKHGGDALRGQGLLEASHMAGSERPDATRECSLYY